MQVMYITSTGVERDYSQEALEYPVQDLEALLNYAAVCNVSPAAIAGAIAEENDSYEDGFVKQWLADKYAEYNTYIYGHDVWQIYYEGATSSASTTPPTEAEKLLNPALIDVGPASIKIATAIDLLIDYQYAQSGTGEDPLQLLDKGYIDNYDLFVRDLIADEDFLSVKLYGLMINEAETWFADHQAYGADWDSLPQEFKDALYVTYVNFGSDLMEMRYQEQMNENARYEPVPAEGTGGGVNHLANAQTIGALVGIEGYGDAVVALDETSLSAAAKQDTQEGLAIRYSLVNLQQTVLVGRDFSGFNQQGEFDIYDSASETGTLTNEWIDDRAAFLLAYSWQKPGETNFTIHGDLTPKDFDPASSGIQTQTDELDNIITTNELEPDRKDTLYDSEGNDAIYGYGGDDYINAWRGGDDYLDGGAGPGQGLCQRCRESSMA